MKVFQLFAISLLLSSSAANASCGAAFCSLSTDWDIQSVASKPGVRLDIPAEFIDLNQLRSGAHRLRQQAM